MPVNRRTVIRSVGATSSIAALAGCIGVSENTPTPEDDGGGNGNGGGGNGNGGDSDDTSEPTPTPDPGTVTFWHSRNEQEGKVLEEDVSTFDDGSPHTVDVAEIAELDTKTTSAIPAGDGPHLFEWAHDWVGDYWERGFLSDQSDELAVDLESTYTKPAQNAVTYKGNVVGLPYAAETVALMYNKDMVDQPPETLSEMKSIMEDHHDPENNQFGLGYMIGAYFVSGYAHAFGGYYFDDETEELGLTNEETLKGLRIVIDELDQYSPEDTGWGPQAAVFLEGNAPLHVNGPWFMPDVRDNDLDVGITTLPAPDGGTPSPYTGIQTWYFTKEMDDGVDTNAEAARQFAEWYSTNEDVLVQNAQDVGLIPVHEGVASRDDLGDTVDGFARSVADGVAMPNNPKMNAVWAEVGPAIDKAVQGEERLEDAMATAEDRIRDEWES